MKAFLHTKFFICGIIFAALFIFSCEKVRADRGLDSLYAVLHQQKADTAKIDAMNAIAVYWSKTNIDSAIAISNRILKECLRLGNNGRCANTYYFIGTMYFLKGDYPKVLQQHFQALRLAEKSNMTRFCGQTEIAVGNVFLMQGEYEKSRTYYRKAFSSFALLKDTGSMARTYSNIGLAYAYEVRTDSALFYFQKALDYRKRVPDLQEEANIYDFMSFTYINAQNYEKALDYGNRSLAINRKLGGTIRILDNLRNIGECHLKLKQYSAAEKELLESLELSKQFGHINGIEGNSVLLQELYMKSNNYEKALQFYERYIALRDSMYNLENKKSTLQQEIQFEYDKKAAADSVRTVEEKKVTAVQLKHEETQRYALYGGLALVGFFAVFMFNRYRVIHSQKQIIGSQKKLVEEQKHIVEEKQKEILDSIHYAKRIQLSHLPTEKYLDLSFRRLKKT